MNLKAIACIGKNNELGKNNDLIWNYKEDLKHFKETTEGSIVIMGKVTYDSLFVKPLPKRINIVLSDVDVDYDPSVIVVNSLEDLKNVLEAFEDEEDNFNKYVIGGGSVYKLLLPYTNELILTEVDDECDEAEVYFPEFDRSEWIKKTLNKDRHGRFEINSYTRK